MSLRKKLNETAEKIPYVGDVLAREIGIKEIGVAALGAYMVLVSAAPALAADASVELVSGVDADNYTHTTIDAKLSGELAKRTGIFLRNRTGIDSESMVNSFTCIDLTYALGKGFDAVGETQFSAGAEIDPRLGVQYFHKFRNGITTYALVTRNFNDDPNTELTGVLGYSGILKGEWKLMGRWEEIINIGDETYNYDTTRLRLGINRGRFSFGPALDISGIGSGERPTYIPGGFVQVKLK